MEFTEAQEKLLLLLSALQLSEDTIILVMHFAKTDAAVSLIASEIYKLSMEDVMIHDNKMIQIIMDLMSSEDQPKIPEFV